MNKCQERYKDLFDLFDKAEKIIKKIEFLKQYGLNIPSVNQLRYAGRHILESLITEDINTIKGNIHEAKDHCKRAIYDALEIGILHYLGKIRIFVEDYKDFPISTVIPTYVEKLARVNEIQKYIENSSRSNISDTDETERVLFEIKQIAEFLDVARQELNTAIKIENEKIIREDRFATYRLIAIIIAALSILIGVLLKTI